MKNCQAHLCSIRRLSNAQSQPCLVGFLTAVSLRAGESVGNRTADPTGSEVGGRSARFCSAAWNGACRATTAFSLRGEATRGMVLLTPALSSWHLSSTANLLQVGALFRAGRQLRRSTIMNHHRPASTTRGLKRFSDGREDGPTIVFVHGWPDDHSMWDKQVCCVRRMVGSQGRCLVYIRTYFCDVRSSVE